MFAWARTPDEAVDELATWAASLPGDFGLDVHPHGELDELRLTGTLVSSGCRLSATLYIVATVDGIGVPQYRFDLRTPDDDLVWRHDCHPGHTTEPGMTGEQHQHLIRSGAEVRVPDDFQTLASIREALVSANLDLSEPGTD